MKTELITPLITSLQDHNFSQKAQVNPCGLNLASILLSSILNHNGDLFPVVHSGSDPTPICLDLHLAIPDLSGHCHPDFLSRSSTTNKGQRERSPS